MLGKKIIAIVPARAGSKRLPGKNGKTINGKPLIQWTIDAAMQSELVDRVLVTTDCSDIAALSKELGAWVPFIRPEELSSDCATTIDVVKHSLSFLSDRGDVYDYVMVLQPTSPLRDINDINAAINLMYQRNGDAVISVCPCEHPPQWANQLDESLSLDNFLSDDLKSGARSQELPTHYRLNGAIYIVNIQKFLQENSLFLKRNSYAYVMESNHSIDIDNIIDFKLAELLMNEKGLNAL